MASTPDELTVTYTEDGIDIVKELDKVVLTKGAWTTLIFRYQEWNRAKAGVRSGEVHHPALPEAQR